MEVPPVPIGPSTVDPGRHVRAGPPPGSGEAAPATSPGLTLEPSWTGPAKADGPATDDEVRPLRIATIQVTAGPPPGVERGSPVRPSEA